MHNSNWYQIKNVPSIYTQNHIATEKYLQFLNQEDLYFHFCWAEEGKEITVRKLESRRGTSKDTPLICQKIRSSESSCH